MDIVSTCLSTLALSVLSGLSVGMGVFVLYATNLFGTINKLINKFMWKDLPEEKEEILAKLKGGGFFSRLAFEWMLCEVCQSLWFSILFAVAISPMSGYLIAGLSILPSATMGYWIKTNLGECKGCKRASDELKALKEQRRATRGQE